MVPAVDLARAAGEVANYCDSAEHNEALERSWVLGAGNSLRSTAFSLAAALGLDAVELYAERLGSIEGRGVAGALTDAFDGSAAACAAESWLELQLVQLRHDRHYHPDVAGLSNCEQLRHYAFHLAKLSAAYVAALADPAARREITERRLADTLLFGLKLATVMGERLPDDALPGRG